MNSYIRIKWTLTEPTPLIKAYDETTWALTPETKLGPEISINFLKALHVKWVALMKGLSPSDLKKSLHTRIPGRISRSTGSFILYAWHGDHHLAHITTLKERMGWK